MLYKKYHRNFVRKFKKGTKFEYIEGRGPGIKFTVSIEPYSDWRYWKGIGIRIKTSGENLWNLVYPEGQLEEDIYAIQEIS